MNTPNNVVPASIAHALLQHLRKDFPVFHDCLPLAIGIDKQILARLPETDRKVLRVALAMHTKSSNYLRRLSKAKTRFNLDGSAAEDLNQSHQAYASTVLNERAKRNEANQQAQRELELQAQREAAEAEAARIRAEKIAQLAAKFSRSGT